MPSRLGQLERALLDELRADRLAGPVLDPCADLRTQLAKCNDEVTRLRAVVDMQLQEIDRLNAEVQGLRKAAEAPPVAKTLAAILQAIDSGGRALPEMAIVEASAELRAPLTVSGDAGLVMDESVLYPPEALSTFRLRLRALPPAPGS